VKRKNSLWDKIKETFRMGIIVEVNDTLVDMVLTETANILLIIEES